MNLLEDTKASLTNMLHYCWSSGPEWELQLENWRSPTNSGRNQGAMLKDFVYYFYDRKIISDCSRNKSFSTQIKQ
jgi:hypothetical protein